MYDPEITGRLPVTGICMGRENKMGFCYFHGKSYKN